MNIKRNILIAVAGTLFVAAVPASAQGLGGALGGAAGGALGGSFGGRDINGSMAGSGGGSMIGSGRFGDNGGIGSMRDRGQQLGGRTRGAADHAATAGRSRLDGARTNGDATAQASKSAALQTGRRSADTAGDASDSASPPAPQAQTRDSGLLVEGGGAGGIEKQFMGRNVAAQGDGGSRTRADRSGFETQSGGGGDFAVTKPAPAPARLRPLSRRPRLPTKTRNE